MEHCFSDAHIHIADIKDWHPVNNSPVCSCAHSVNEYEILQVIKNIYPECIEIAYGIHPQNPDKNQIDFLNQLVVQNKINIIGEAGFDLYTSEYASHLEEQEFVWNFQLDLAVKYNKILVIHCRKALDKIFTYTKQLAKLPAVVFHSFPGSPVEAMGFIKRGVNAYFSLGKQLLNGNKRAISCANQLSVERILLETDAPYQTLKGQDFTPTQDIIQVYEEFSKIRNMPLESVCENVEKNFLKVFISTSNIRI